MKKLIILMITFIVTMSPVLASTQISSRISQSSDDAEESISSGSMDISGSDLELVDDQVIGMRFNNIDIPPGVNIINAYIQFTVDETKGSGSGAILDFHAQAIDSAQTFTSSTYDISSRIKTNMAIQWNVAAWNSVGEASVDQVTPDLSSVIQEIVDRPGWTQFNSIAIIVTGAGTRTAEAFDGESVAAPLLVIEYESGPPECSDGIDNDADGLIDFPSDPECLSEADNDEIDALSTTTISSIISQSSDDAEERSGGSMDLSSSDLELVFDDSNQEVGMRFQNIGIPQAAIITNAYIEFAADETNSVTTNLELFAQDTDNAPTFSSSSNNISNRIKTSASVQWNDIPAWSSVSEKHRSPDISTIIQEVIDRGGWLSGNSIAIIVAGSGERTAEAYDGESQNAALLVIEYTTEQPVYQCADGFDNDGDGLIDMADSGCASFTDTSEFADNECDDGLDNDGDGLIDVADSGCSSFSDTSEFADNECDDGLDNDGDGLTDVADQGCFSASDVSEFADNECDDGFDNDGDGLIDVADSGCASSSDTSEFAGNECDDDLDNDGDGLTDVADPGCSSASDVSEFADNECDDGLDNDGDGLTDIADPGCIDLTGFDETNCGDGICEAEESWQTCPLDCAVPQCSDGIDNDADGLADFPNDPGCLSDTDDNEIDELPTATISSIISQSSDDAEEKSGGSMSLSSSDLELVYDGSNQVVGMRFQNIEIPQAAIITNAYIEFAADETNSITTNLELFAQDTDNAPTFSASSYDISSRIKTSASVQWSNVPAWNSVSEKHRSPDISPIIQAVIDRGGWLSGNSIVIIVTGTGKRTAESYNGESQNAPLLAIEYTIGEPVYQCADGLDNDGDGLIDTADSGCVSSSDTSELGDSACDDGIDNDGDGSIDTADSGCASSSDTSELGDNACDDGIDNDADGLIDFPNDPGCLSGTDDNEIDELPTTTISSIISQSSDDAEEKSGGSMSLSSSDLELVYDGSNQVVGMRFQNIEIPQAAIITNAYIEFAADETNSVTTNLELFAQDTDNAPTFLTSSYDISSRVKTSASVQWSNVPAWNSVSEKHRSPDISLIIQAVIGRSGWLSGNSIVIIVTGTGKRTAESYNGESQNAPLLVIEYTTEAPVSQCADGLDNDGDSLIDMADFGCADASDTSEFADNECDDGLDNDGDGLIDIADQGCIDLTGFDETNCGDGICEAEESEQTCPLDCTEPEFGLLNVTGNNEDLIEGTFTPSNSADLPNLGTQYKRLIHRGGFGTDSVCGLRGEIIKVTNLNDSGSGSLRDAVNQNGPRTIVFEVSGAIKLQSQLEINSPFITIAGQTAPPPGISLYHQVLSVHTHDVCLQHIRVRLGDRDHNLNLISGKEAEVADTVMISGGFDPGGTYNVVLDNMSVSWSIDETISFFDGVSNLTIRDSIIAEPLRLSVHEDDHAYCFFIQDSERVSVIGNLLGHCQRRSLRMDGGTLQYVNNFVYNPGEYAVHVHELPIHVTMVGNVMDFPDDAGNRWNYSGAEEFFASRSPEAKVYFLGNKSFEDRPLHQARDEGLPVVLQSVPRVWEGNVMALTAADVAEWISNWVGAFPLHRDLVDARIIEGVRTHTGTYLDSQMDNGGYVDVEENQRILTLPENPQGDDDNDGISNLVEWLQLYTDAIE